MSLIDKCTTVFDILVYTHVVWVNGWHALFCITNNRHDVTIMTHAIKRHFLIWMTTARQPTKCLCSCVLTLKYTFFCVYSWTRQRIHNTLIVVDRYLRLMGDKTIPDSAEPRLESFYPPFVAGIELPHQGVVDSYNLYSGNSCTNKKIFFHWNGLLVIKSGVTMFSVRFRCHIHHHRYHHVATAAATNFPSVVKTDYLTYLGQRK